MGTAAFEGDAACDPLSIFIRRSMAACRARGVTINPGGIMYSLPRGKSLMSNSVTICPVDRCGGWKLRPIFSILSSFTPDSGVIASACEVVESPSRIAMWRSIATWRARGVTIEPGGIVKDPPKGRSSKSCSVTSWSACRCGGLKCLPAASIFSLLTLEPGTIESACELGSLSLMMEIWRSIATWRARGVTIESFETLISPP